MAQTVPSTRLDQAVHNNAIWCDMVCGTHGIPGEFQPEIWVNPKPTPPYYPNAVTLSGASGIAGQTRVIQRLLDDGLSGFAVKDSFLTLDLSQLGFQQLFEAKWLWRDPSLPKPPALLADIRFTVVQQPAELERWEMAWADLPADQRLAPESRIFLPSLLNHPGVTFIAAYRDEQIVGGAIGNRTGEVVGISNQFAPDGEAAPYWAGCMGALMAAYPGLALVGYERGEDLEIARTLGFNEIGGLQVWAVS